MADGCPKVAWIRVPGIQGGNQALGRPTDDPLAGGVNLQDVAKGLFAPGAVANDLTRYPRPFPADLGS